jgi:molecular chaperone DnaK (HSP70)
MRRASPVVSIQHDQGDKNINLDEAVAYGAAVQGTILSDNTFEKMFSSLAVPVSRLLDVS